MFIIVGGLSFVTYSAVPARRLSFVTYSAAPARRLSFAHPSSHTRLCQLADFPSLNLRLLCAPHFVKLSEFDKVVQPSSHTRLRQLADFPSSHTRLCQLADFPSLILRLSFAHPSLILRSEEF